GDTTGAISLGDSGFESAVFDPLKFEVLRAPGYGDPGWLKAALSLVEARAAEIAAVVLEPLVQAASGMLVGDASQVRELATRCRDKGILVITDEVATGFGRTGAMFASELCGLEPDLMCIGKGLTGGYLPMSATVASEAVYREFLGEDSGPLTFYHGHSYGGNALAAAVALAHLELMERWRVLEHVRAMADHLGSLLERDVAGQRGVKEVRRAGLMVGVELAPRGKGLELGKRVCA
ncbi:Aminotransferase class-III, partial [mine drainage metagenome]